MHPAQLAVIHQNMMVPVEVPHLIMIMLAMMWFLVVM
jgi:hypothetical protein